MIRSKNHFRVWERRDIKTQIKGGDKTKKVIYIVCMIALIASIIVMPASGYIHSVKEKPGMAHGYWTPDSDIVSGLSGNISRSAPTVFNKDGIWYLIVGADDGAFYGYNWTGSAWQQDDAIISGLGYVGNQSAPAVFCMNGTWYLIAGRMHGFNGFNRTSSTWQQDDAIVVGSLVYYYGGTNYLNKPAVFYKDGTWYLISGNMPRWTAGAWANNIRFFGHKWTGSAWEYATSGYGFSDGIISGLPWSYLYHLAPTVFYVDERWYLISGCESGEFPGWNWTGSTWQQDDAVTLGLRDVGSRSTPTVFCMNGTWYLISGEDSGGFHGFRYRTTATIPPDLIPTSLQPTTFSVNQTSNVTVTVKNEGGSAGSFNVSLKLDEALIGIKTVDSMSAGEEKTVNFTFTPASGGTFNLTATVDQEGVITELNEDNNVIVETVTILRPDLTPTSLQPTMLFFINETNTITATVKNDGGVPAGSFNVSLKADGILVDTKTMDSLGVSEEKTIAINWTPPSAGTFNLTVTVDSDAVILESNETNNNLTVQATVTIGDLVPTSIEPLTLCVNLTNYIRVTVENSGTGDISSAFNVSLKVEEMTIGTKTIESLNAGAEKTVIFKWMPTSLGTFNLTVTADPEDVIVELNETNNNLTEEVDVIEPMTIYVPENYSTIQDAIDNAVPGTTIIVSPKSDTNVYEEHVEIPEDIYGIRLIANGTVVIKYDAYNGDQITVRGAGCTIQGFDLKDGWTGGWYPNWPGAGVRLCSDSNIVKDNYIYHTSGGIEIVDSSYNVIENNTVGPGILNLMAIWGDYNLIANNTFGSDTGYGWMLGAVYTSTGCSNKPASHNTVMGNTFAKYATLEGSDNLIYDNKFSGGGSLGSDNTYNISKTSGTNIMGGPYLGGNYWSGYSGTDDDKDGIGDTPYSYDLLPLVEPKPDLVPTSLTPTTLSVNQSNTLTATIWNNGTAAADQFNVSLQVEDTVIENETVASLGAGNSTDVAFTWTPIAIGTYNLTVTADSKDVIVESNETNNILSVQVNVIEGHFDTGYGQYPSISGVHNGTIIPDRNITVNWIYTYPCAGTGGHTEFAMIWDETTGDCAEANWDGYQGDYHNISFNRTLTLKNGVVYNYMIITSSYPQIIHAPYKQVIGGNITCTEFGDANGKVYHDWIPAIRLW